MAATLRSRWPKVAIPRNLFAVIPRLIAEFATAASILGTTQE